MSDHSMPKYMLLKKEIITWLHGGKLQPNDRMPSENEISERYRMSRETVRHALGELEQEGWVYRIRGKGTFVARPPANQTLGKDVRTIGIMTTYISDYIFPHIVRGAEGALRERGYRLSLSSTDNDKQKEREGLEMLSSQPLSGVIIEPTKSAEGNPNLDYFLMLEYRSIPYLMINERYPELSCPCLKLDDERGGFIAAEHLMQLGHKRIAGFFKTDDLQGANRLKGFIRAHQHYRIPLSPEQVVRYGTEDKRTKPYEAASQMFGQAEGRPTALVCYNDELAVLLLEVLRLRGLGVPQDVSIVGFDDSSLATATEVKLTTVAHPKQQMGVDAAERLMAMIEGLAPLESEPVVYKPELIVRDSSCAAKL